MIAAPLCRASDPLTSFEAAHDAKALIKSHERQIIQALKLHGPQGVNGIAAFAFIEAHSVGKRMINLERMGEVVLTGKKVLSNKKCWQREWKVT